VRRRAILSTAALGLGATAGCLGSVFETTNSRSPSVLADRPDAVYVPSHQEEMGTIGRATAGDLAVAVTYSYPHRFWTVEREDGSWTTIRTEVTRDDAVHLMATPFHEPTGTVVPNTGLSAELTRDGSLVSQEIVYPMLSQRMGVHYGANFPLPGDGSYDVTVSVGGTGDERYGAFEGLFGDPATGTVSFEYSEAARNDLALQRLDDRAGERAAVDPMSMGMLPDGRLPDPLPGDRVGTATLGDARFVLTPSGSAAPTSPSPHRRRTTGSRSPASGSLRPLATRRSVSARRLTPPSASTTARPSTSTASSPSPWMCLRRSRVTRATKRPFSRPGRRHSADPALDCRCIGKKYTGSWPHKTALSGSNW